jgi:hypothetical protein
MGERLRLFELGNYESLLQFYREVDREYFPRLSERPGGLEGHILTILQNNGSFVLFEVDGRVEGACGFFPLDSKRKFVQFTFFTFSSKYRNSLAPYKMVKFLLGIKDELGYHATEKLIARTWYEESADRMERLGFEKVAVVENDVVEGRTSYYFEGDLNVIVSRSKIL